MCIRDSFGLDGILQDLLHLAGAHLLALVVGEAFAEEELEQDGAIVRLHVLAVGLSLIHI